LLFASNLSQVSGTFGELLLLVPLEDEVKGGEDVEEEDCELQFGPVVSAEVRHLEVLVVHFEGEPGPLHFSCFSLILVKIFK
jgi:hypothetical protein